MTTDVPQVVYYSRTGTTHSVATDLADHLPDAQRHRIRSVTERSYPNWLARSFVPGATVDVDPVRTDVRDASAVFLGTPKWTVACPPVNAYVERLRAEGVPLGLFVTYGGFDEHRYARRLSQRLDERGADVRARLLVQRDEVGTDAYERGLAEFVAAVLDDAETA